MAFFQANPYWASTSQQAVTHTISFACRYAEQGDYEVARSALHAVTLINASYIKAKGKTFFPYHPLSGISQVTDNFISETIEHLRVLAQGATSRGDEEQIRQIFAALENLVQVYMQIDYANEYATKQHAHLAASYLMGAVEANLPHNRPDVLMEGVRLMGQSAQHFLAAGDPNSIVTLADKISLISCAGALNQNLRPVTLTGMEQLAQLTFNLIRAKTHDIHFPIGRVRENVAFIVRMFLNTPDAPLSSGHSRYLAPYYSLTTTEALGTWLANLANQINKAEADNTDASAVIRNIEQWADRIYSTEKELLLLAIEKKSHFTFDLLHWIAHVTKLLVFISQAPATNTHIKEELQNHGRWLISALSFIPDDENTIAFIENFDVTELLFEVARDTMRFGGDEVSQTPRNLLLFWAFKAGRHNVGWAILERAMCALATLVLWKDEITLVPWLKTELTKMLNTEKAPEQEIRNNAAREIRERAATLYNPGFELSQIHHAMSQIDQEKMRLLLQEIADLLSPGTAGEPVDLLWR
jgi:hypothetical protein